MTTLATIVHALHGAARADESVVLASVVRVVGSSYGGVGARMVVRVDGTTVGLVSGGCLESDLAQHARRVHGTRRAEIVTYDARADDDAVWGLGLGCNGMIDVLLEPLAPVEASSLAALLDAALHGDGPSVLATVVQRGDDAPDGAPAIGAHALLALDGDATACTTMGRWGDGAALACVQASVADALAAGRRGAIHEADGVQVAFEVVTPAVRLVICGSGPDAVPVARLATQLGWDVSVIDHRPLAHAHADRFPGARVVECGDAARLADVVALPARTAAVVMSHHFARDSDFVQALLAAGIAYVGVLGPRARTDRVLAELAARGSAPSDAGQRLYGPVGLDLGGDGPEAIALAIIAEVAAVTAGRTGGSLRDRRAALHEARAVHGSARTA